MLVTIPSGDAVSWFEIILLTISKLTPVDGIQVYVDIGYSKNKMISIHVMSFPDAPCMDFVPAFGECGGGKCKYSVYMEHLGFDWFEGTPKNREWCFRPH